jgi:hypothetical protein
MDLTARLPLEPFNVYVASTGSLIDPPTTTGKPFLSLGTIRPDKDGYGDLFKELDGELWEWVGRACVVESEKQGGVQVSAATKGMEGTGKIYAGVVARSAGAWGNDKTVCACSGRTMWEEGRDMEKSML